MNPIILIGCFTPLVIIFLVMKVAVWLSAVNTESGLCQTRIHENEDPSWRMHMQTLMKRKKSMEIAQTIDDALYQYYTVENELPVPNWRQIRDPEWWVQYLKDMGIDPSNP